jgi:BarA-like signal transduction histidine kinase
MMDWEKLYKEYLGRCISKPITFEQFVKLREGLLKKKKLEEQKKKWFSYE